MSKKSKWKLKSASHQKGIFLTKSELRYYSQKKLTVNSPVAGSYPTWTVCSKFDGFEMTGFSAASFLSLFSKTVQFHFYSNPKMTYSSKTDSTCSFFSSAALQAPWAVVWDQRPEKQEALIRKTGNGKNGQNNERKLNEKCSGTI